MNTRKGFTLIELLCVVALMVLLSALVIPALQGSSAANLTTAGAKLATMLDAARQTAIVNRQPVAVAMLPADSSSVQRFTGLLYTSGSGTSGTWVQTAKWTALPPGILSGTATQTDSSGNTFPLNAFQPQFSPGVPAVSGTTSLPSLYYAGKTYSPGTPGGGFNSSSYGYIVFLADGSLYQNQNDGMPSIPCIARLVQGITNGQGGIQTYTGPKNSSGGPANYCDIVVNDTTGQVKLVRP